MSTQPTWYVGQTVYVCESTRGRRDQKGVVTKVGRTLITVKPEHGREAQYRIDDTWGNGRAKKNNAYSSTSAWVQTEESYLVEQREARARQMLWDAGLEMRPAFRDRFSTDLLEAIVDLIVQRQGEQSRG